MDRDERDLLCAFLIFTVVISVVGGFILYEAPPWAWETLKPFIHQLTS